ncbi:peptidase domain-containing ABC transporter [Proteiniphilum sp.]|jgi:ATP-binding cassette subfamily B protein|uniref:peptidase domain-containing ABC transporter n=1 Tax=Proteiniphilum sp. TaxID=1926877 RepID=UPI0009295DDE|nr:peptidase domain-containing ABC transporter [Proteiniphilum sp.]MEA5127954.1 peptidase domain-containing ABC transporter [Proteiniphilum sp.]OJV81628.1 MAG: peptidase C39 [Bacteroidia bacterium 44-10]
MKRGTKIKQHDITDCGPACLASICAYHGLRYPIAKIRQYAFTDQKGTNLLGLIEVSKRLGLEARGVRGDYDTLIQHGVYPAIAHIVVKNALHHFVVIYKADPKHIHVMDPADGKMHKLTREEFEKEWSGILLLIKKDESFQGGKQTQSVMRRFLGLLLPHKALMFQALFGAIIFSILGLSTSVYVGKITDYVLIDKNYNLLHLMGIIMILIILLRTFIGSMKSILALRTGQHIDAVLILGYYKHLLTLPQQFFDTMRVGEIISRVGDAVKIRNFINNVSIDLVVNVMILFFSLCVMFVYSWQLALITLASAPLFLIIYVGFNRLNRKYQRRIMESNAELESQLVESINSINTIKRFGVEDFANVKTENRFVRLLRNTFRSIYGAIIAQGGIQFVSSGITVAVLWVGSTLVIKQQITPGTLMLFYSLVGYVIGPVGSLITANQTVQDAVIAADRLFQIMDLEREEQAGEHKQNLWRSSIGDITLDHVSFRYGSRKQVFTDLSLVIPKGKTTAIVGESGSGKTTLISLLQHIYPIQGGSIRIGKYDIKQITNESLRELVGTVPQQIELFAGTILENIALGDFQPDVKRVSEITEQLGLGDFIRSLPNGFATYIGEHGASLSGGEKQRIAIARALYKDPEVLIFDEATSSLDSISEKYVKETLNDLAAKGKTIIVIAHRLSTVRDADNIVVLEEGRLAEQGSHDSLLQNRGVYAKLWNEQFNVIR